MVRVARTCQQIVFLTCSLLLFSLSLNCASTPPPSEVDRVFDDGLAAKELQELIIGVFNMDDELGRAEFTLYCEWSHGRKEMLLENWKLPKWNLLDGRDTPGTYTNVRLKVAELPARVVVVDHLRERSRVFELLEGDSDPFVVFTFAPRNIAVWARNANGDETRERPQ